MGMDEFEEKLEELEALYNEVESLSEQVNSLRDEGHLLYEELSEAAENFDCVDIEDKYFKWFAGNH